MKVANLFIARGFPYVKVELEANVQPRDYGYEVECDVCSGSGRIQCYTCNFSGHVRTTCSTCSGSENIGSQSNETESRPDCHNVQRETVCEPCSDGYVDCSECSGRGYFRDDEWYEFYHDKFWEVFFDKLGGITDILEHKCRISVPAN